VISSMQLVQDAATHRPRERGKAPAVGTKPAATARALDDRLLIVCGLAWGAGLIHVSAAIEHVNEYALHAVFFAVLAAAQFGWGVALYRRPAPRLLWVGAVASLMVVGLWVASRTIGLPIGPRPWSPEAAGATDVIATADEVVLALVVGFQLWPGRGGVLVRRAGYLVTAAGVCLLLLSSLVLLGGGHGS